MSLWQFTVQNARDAMNFRFFFTPCWVYTHSSLKRCCCCCHLWNFLDWFKASCFLCFSRKVHAATCKHKFELVALNYMHGLSWIETAVMMFTWFSGVKKQIGLNSGRNQNGKEAKTPTLWVRLTLNLLHTS